MQQLGVEEPGLVLDAGQQRFERLAIAAPQFVADFGGKVPGDMVDLLKIPGVARKTANVVLGTWFKKNIGVVVDTHVTRISRRWELTQHNDAPKIELGDYRVVEPNAACEFLFGNRRGMSSSNQTQPGDGGGRRVHRVAHRRQRVARHRAHDA